MAGFDGSPAWPAGLTIRTGRPVDVARILDLITELADYEKLRHEVVATVESLRETLFGGRPDAQVRLGELEGETVAFAIFFHNFSTFQGRPGLYLEDLYVRPAHRGRGIGRAMLAHLARLARQRNCGRFEWSVLDWNRPAIGFYEKLGARPMDEWTVYRLTGEPLDRLAAEAAPPATDPVREPVSTPPDPPGRLAVMLATHEPERPVRLRDGRAGVIRPIHPDDAVEDRALDLALVEDGRGMVMDHDDVSASDDAHREALETWLAGPGRGTAGGRWVALVEGRLEGTACIHRLGPSRIRHVAAASLAVHPRCQGLGLGRHLLDHALSWAQHGPGTGILRVELAVRADNPRALDLYRSLGFVVEGVRVRFVRRADGTFVDDLIMAGFLDGTG